MSVRKCGCVCESVWMWCSLWMSVLWRWLSVLWVSDCGCLCYFVFKCEHIFAYVCECMEFWLCDYTTEHIRMYHSIEFVGMHHSVSEHFAFECASVCMTMWGYVGKCLCECEFMWLCVYLYGCLISWLCVYDYMFVYFQCVLIWV